MPEISRKTILLAIVVMLLIVFLYVQNRNSEKVEAYENGENGNDPVISGSSQSNQQTTTATTSTGTAKGYGTSTETAKGYGTSTGTAGTAIGGAQYTPKTDEEKAISNATEVLVKALMKSSNKLEWNAIADKAGQTVTDVIKYVGMMSKYAEQDEAVAKNIGNMAARITGQALKRVDETVKQTNSYY